MSTPSPTSRILGCLMGAAVAEAAAIAGVPEAGGAPRAGADEPAGALLPLGAAGQLTLFTADALIEAIEWANDGIHADEAACVWLASLRWVSAQGVPISGRAPMAQPRWLDAQDGVLVPAAVRPSWISSLADGEMGSPARPVGRAFDDAGAAAHSAPYGLIPHMPAASVVKMSVDGASLTHGAPVAVQAAAAVASLAHFLALGADAVTAAGSARAQIASLRSPDARLLAAFDAASDPGAADGSSGRASDASGTLAAALAAVLAAESAAASGDAAPAAFAAGVGLAAREGSDAAAIAGALLGTLWGADAVPTSWSRHTAGIGAAEGLAARFAQATGA